MNNKKLCMFKNVDIISTLYRIMLENTVYYQQDFDVDCRIILSAAKGTDRKDKYLLWMSRPSGTWCFYERDVYIKRIQANTVWRYYGDTSDRILAYAVHITGMSDDGVTVYGDIYELNYAEHKKCVEKLSAESNSAMLIYKHGTKTVSLDAGIPIPEPELGQLVRYIRLPADEFAFAEMLKQEHQKREKQIEISVEEHLKNLRLIAAEMEAKRIITMFLSGKNVSECNTHFCMTEISPWYTTLAEKAEQSDPDRYGTFTWHKPLLAILPYPSATVVKEDGRPYIVIAKRDQKRKRLRSIASN